MEIISHAVAVVVLIAAYPLRLLSLQHAEGLVRVENRFQIPPSFDPANVLYPVFLPVLIALSLLPQVQGLLLPNLILGLASLPPRLFPPSSRFVGINSVHWLISLVPLITSRTIQWLSRMFYPPLVARFFAPVGPQATVLSPETLTLLYPLHQALLPPIHYLTTTSLLPAEKQLISTALIDLLYFARAPQAVILRSILWIGGISTFVLCMHVLHWNVVLARVPSWRFRGGTTLRRRQSMLSDICADVLSILRSFRANHSNDVLSDSDADEDEPLRYSRHRTPSLLVRSSTTRDSRLEPQSAIEPSSNGHKKPWDDFEFKISHKRRNTMASVSESLQVLAGSNIAELEHNTRRRKHDWILTLNTHGAVRRKATYAAYLYACILTIILLPIRLIVSKYALHGAEPVFWALNYLFGDLHLVYDHWVSLEKFSISIFTSHIADLLSSVNSMPELGAIIGSANVRLLLIAYWVLVFSIGLVAVLLLTALIEVDTRRKIFHGIMVTMLLPSTFVDPCFCAFTLTLVLAVFLLLEILRAGQVPPLGSAIGRFVAPYVDGRDLRGPVVVSHIFLLVGCAVPLWLSLAAFPRSADGWRRLEKQERSQWYQA